jgi:protein-disulfide isomerase
MRRAWASAALVVVALPVAWSYLQGGPAARTVPAEVASLWVPGKINVVEMADFQCPFCREAHPRLKEALAPYEGRVHLVRLNMPLAMHPDARSAARAYACADDQGKGEAMADALFASGDLGPAGCRALAERVGVDLGKYDRCIAGSAVDRRIDGEMARVRAAGLEGLPTVWIGDQRLLGLTDTQKIRDALAHAAGEPSGPALSAAWMWGALAVASAAFAAFAVRRARAAAPPA